MSVGENIRRRRLDAGLRQEDVAKRVGVTQAMLAQIERGTRNPSLQVGLAIAEMLSCSVESLCREESLPQEAGKTRRKKGGSPIENPGQLHIEDFTA